MTRRTELDAAVGALLKAPFSTRRGSVVPTTDKIALSNGGVYIKAVYLYADLADSSGMARLFRPETAAKIIRAYLSAVTRVLRYHGGEIRSFDGDRVMAVFMGSTAPSKAARAALELKWVVDNVVHPQLDKQFRAYNTNNWVVKSRSGIDFGTAFVVRAGVRNSNDLVSVGDAPNVAAKLSDLKVGRTMITDRFWKVLDQPNRFIGRGATARAIWTDPKERNIGGRAVMVRSSSMGQAIK